jgi:DNA-binding transcriptional LysR family regulator
MIMSLPSAHLDAFYTVSQTLNFTKAAERLHITQSALSQRILNLEEELGVTLFIRDRAGLKLTEAASQLVRYCQIKAGLEDEFISSVKSLNSHELSGTVRIGGFSSVTASVTVPIMSDFIQAHPKVKFQSLTREFDELFDLLKRGEIDYMILDDRLVREEFERVLLGKEINYLVKSKTFPKKEIYLDHDENDEITLKYLKQAKISTKNIERHYLDDIYGLIEGVKNNLGKAVLPLHLIKHQHGLEIVNPSESLQIPVYMYYYSRPYYSKLHAAVIKELKQGFERLLGDK